MAILQTKYVGVGSFTYGALLNRGFNTDVSIGSISNTSGGTSNVNLDSVYSGADVVICNWASDGSTTSVILSLTGNRSNSGWATMTVGSYTYNRSSATYSYSSSNNRTSWVWSSSTNPFGNSGNVAVQWDDGAATPTYSITNNSNTVAGGSTASFTWASNTSGTYYYNSSRFGSGTLGTGTGGTKTLTASNTFSGNTTTSSVTMRTGGVGGAIKATSGSVTIYKTPSTPSVATSNVSTSGFTATATAGSTNAGTLQVSLNSNFSSVFTSPKTFTGLSANTTYTVYARQNNSNIGISGTSTTTVTTSANPAPLDTNITLTSSSIVVGNTTSSYTQGLTGGGSNTLYYILNANNLANGSNIDALRTGGDSRYIARTYTSTSSRSFRTSASGSNIITNLPSSSTSDTYYVYAANTSGTNSTLLSDTYIVDRPDVSISLTPSTTSLSASDALDDATSPTVNVTGDTSGTQYRLYTNNIPRWIDTHNGGTAASTTDFRIKYSENELPPAGSTYTYFTQARIPSTYGGSGTWINTGNSFTITRSSADLTPDSPTSQLTNLTQRVTSTQYTEDWQTTGITSGNQITWTATVSGGGGSSVQLSTNNSTWVTGAQGIQRSLNQTGYVRVGTGSSQNTTYTATLTSGSTTGSWSVATASTGTGGQQTGGGNAFQYGLEIKNPGGTATIIDSTSKIGTIIATAQYSIAANSAGQQKFLGFDCSNATQTCLIFNAGAQYFNMPYFTRRTAVQQGVILKPNPNAAQTVSGEIYLIRY